MKLITISGLDGSGKSTQIELLKSYLENQGKKVFYFHAIQFGLANKFSGKYNDKNTRSITKASFFKIILRHIFLMIDLFRFKGLLRKLYKQSYNYLISDRYFYDSVINIKYLKEKMCHSCESRNPENKKFTGSRIHRHGGTGKCGMTKNIIKPNIAIYLQTPPEIIMQRERKPDQGLEYLQRKKELYDNAVSIWNLKIIDGNRNKEEIFAEIKNLIL